MPTMSTKQKHHIFKLHGFWWIVSSEFFQSIPPGIRPIANERLWGAINQRSPLLAFDSVRAIQDWFAIGFPDFGEESSLSIK